MTNEATGDTLLLLVRHGETRWNAEGRVQGWLDSPLTSAGVAQARMLAARLADEPVDRIFASDLGRARETAAAIAARLALAVELEPGLRERAYGVLEGCTWAEAEALHPEAYARVAARDHEYVVPGGESAAAFGARVLRALERIAAAHAGKRVVVVAHGGVLGVAYRRAAGLPADAPRTYALANASLNHLRFAGGRLSVERWGDVAHLAVDAADDPTEPAARSSGSGAGSPARGGGR
ncbi:MAG: phosphoglycerate mutase family protein [Burkholderiales bacterium]|nr:phosphoglycerate mutase family protein [Burkholderiales bacterium]